jgi:hypothetical protein
VRTTVGSNLGHTPGMLIEIDCIAYKEIKQATAKRKAVKKARRRR